MTGTICPKCSKGGQFKFSIGFAYKVPIEGEKQKKKTVYISDTITCLQCGFRWNDGAW